MDSLCLFRLGLEGGGGMGIRLWDQVRDSDQREHPSYTSKTPTSYLIILLIIDEPNP